MELPEDKDYERLGKAVAIQLEDLDDWKHQIKLAFLKGVAQAAGVWFFTLFLAGIISGILRAIGVL